MWFGVSVVMVMVLVIVSVDRLVVMIRWCRLNVWVCVVCEWKVFLELFMLFDFFLMDVICKVVVGVIVVGF